MKNESLSEELVELKEKIAERTSEIDKSRGKLSMLQDNLRKMGFKNAEQAKGKLRQIQVDVKKKEQFFKLEIEKLKRRIEDEDS